MLRKFICIAMHTNIYIYIYIYDDDDDDDITFICTKIDPFARAGRK